MNNIAPSELIEKKQEVVDKYVKDIKKDLNILQQGVFLLVEKKVKELLMQNDPLEDSVNNVKLSTIEKMIVQLCPKHLVDKIYKGIRDKQELLLRVKTQEQLEALKQGLPLPPESVDSNHNANPGTQNNASQKIDTSQNQQTTTPAGGEKADDDQEISGADREAMKEMALTAGSVIGGAGGEYLYNNKIRGRIFEKNAEKLGEKMGAEELKKNLEQMRTVLKNKLYDPTLLESQKKSIQQAVDIFDQATSSAKSLDELKLWKKLTLEGKVNEKLLQMCALDAKGVDAMKLISKDSQFLSDIAKASSPQEIEALLKAKNISHISENTMKLLSETKEVTALKDVTRVLSETEGITKLARVTRALPIFDIVFAGVEIYHWANEDYDHIKNADRKANEKQKKGREHSLNIAAVAGPAVYGAIAGSGPVGWLASGLIIGGAVAVDHGLNTLYFDVKDFYLQKRDDFISQMRAEIKQAVVTSFAGATYGNKVSINEKICEFLPGGIEKHKKEQTLEQALEAMIYLEEAPIIAPDVFDIDSNNKLSTLNAQEKASYEKQKTALEKIIKTRMEYIKQFLPGGKNMELFKSAIDKENKGIGFVEKIVEDSRTYGRMMGDNTYNGEKTPDTYKKYLLEKLQKENPTVYATLQNLQKNNPVQRNDFLSQVASFSSINKDAPECQNIAGTLEYLCRYKDIVELGIPLEERFTHTYQYIHSVEMKEKIEALQAGKNPLDVVKIFTEQDVKEVVARHLDEKNNQEQLVYASNVGQNIVYRIAKEFHGYDGPNDMLRLQFFMSENKSESVGLYYDANQTWNDGWRMNNDNAWDKTINIQDISKKNIDNLMQSRFGESWLSWNNTFKILTPMSAPAVSMMQDQPDAIDTKTETVDRQLSTEFLKKVYMIVKEEKEAILPENKKKVQGEIVNYIKTHAKDGYLRLPYDLLNKAARAELGSLQYFYFSVDKNGTINAVTSHEHISEECNLPGVQKKYIHGYETQNSTQLDIQKVEIKNVAKEKKEVMNTTTDLTKKITALAGELSWQGQRGNILYDPVKETITSWQHTIRLVQKPNKTWELADGKYKVVFISMKEALTVANLLNRFANRKKNNEGIELSFGSVLGAGLYDTFKGGGLGNWRGRFGGWIGYKILTAEQIYAQVPTAFKFGANAKETIRFIEKDL